MESSSLVVCNLSFRCPLLDLPISRPPHLPETGAAGPAAFGGRRKRRKSRGGVSGTKKIPGEPSLNPKSRGGWGFCEPVSAPKYQMGRNEIACDDLRTSGPHLFWTRRKKKGVRGGKPERRPDPGPSSLPISRFSRLLNLPFPRSPGDPPASGPNICHMYWFPPPSICFFLRPSSSFFSLSSVIFFPRLSLSSPLCPLPDLPISRPPRLPGREAAEPAVFGGRRKRRKFPVGGNFR